MTMLNSIQILRAFAAWSVVFHHYMQLFHGFESSNIVSRFFSEFGLLGVDLFFIISGFVIYSSASGKIVSPFSFAIQRIARIAPAYWVFTALIAVLTVSFEGLIPRTAFEPVHFIKSIFFIPAYSPTGIGLLPTLSIGWTLNYEMLFYGLFFLSLFLPRKALIPTMAVSITAIQAYAYSSDGAFSFYSRPLIYNFLIGVIISVAYRAGLISKIKPAGAAALFLVAIYSMYLTKNTSHDPIKAGIPLALIFISFVSMESTLNRLSAFKYLGDWSYSTYLSHIIVICVMLKAFKTYQLNEPTVLMIVVATTLIFSWASFQFLEKPISILIKKKKFTERSPSQLVTRG
ncbi:acyltransferase [Pseudomonas frederiksbergensis]|nr:acyltransferase [Pseudomonas frederiksbergensis]